MVRISLSPRAYRQITLVAALLLGVIIVTGAAVRLTGSGLGCPTWPTCTTGRLTPRSASDSHAMIEFLNRMFTGLVSAAVILAVLGSLVRRPRRHDLTWLSIGLVIGVVAQAVLGGLVVKKVLDPTFVMGHFLLSAVLLWNAVVLHQRAGVPDDRRMTVADPTLTWLSRALMLAGGVVLVAGTVVTGAGPHAGDKRAARLDIPVTTAARTHGIAVTVFLALTVAVVVLAYRRGASVTERRALNALLTLIVLQAAIGYLQYFNDVPVGLVAVHVFGATCVWAATVYCATILGRRTTSRAAAPAVSRRRSLVPAT